MTERYRPPAAVPCRSCPYRCDVPSGIWDRTEYDKLARYDQSTGYQPTGVFLCHLQDVDGTSPRICGGWVACHRIDELLSIRLASFHGRILEETVNELYAYRPPVEIFASGAEAAEHGKRDIDDPDLGARLAIQKIEKVRRDLRAE